MKKTAEQIAQDTLQKLAYQTETVAGLLPNYDLNAYLQQYSPVAKLGKYSHNAGFQSNRPE